MAKGRPKGSESGRHLVPLIRGGFTQAIERMKRKESICGIADIWEEILANDPAKALELISRFLPREMLIEVDDARPFAFFDRPLDVNAWKQQHAPVTIEHDTGDSTEH